MGFDRFVGSAVLVFVVTGRALQWNFVWSYVSQDVFEHVKAGEIE